MTSPGGRRRSPRAGRRALVALVALTVVTTVVVAIVLSAGASPPGRSGDEGTTGGRPPAATRSAPPPHGAGATAPALGSTAGAPARTTLGEHWLRVLAGIDRRRATAWRTGDLQALSTVFAPGSVELADDRRMLRGYLARGLHVDGVRMTFVVVEVRRQRPGRVSLLVVDRLGAAVARDRGGQGQPLPRDLPTRHRIVLERVGGQWRIAAVTPA